MFTRYILYSFSCRIVVLFFFAFAFLFSCTAPTTDSKVEEIITSDALQFEDTYVFEAYADSVIGVVFDSLSQTLMQVLSAEGPVAAISYCNVQAVPITQYFESKGLHISRLTNRPRSPLNSLSRESARKAFDFFSSLDPSDLRKNKVSTYNTTQYFYYKPIVLMPHCLVCHGKPNSEIAPETLKVIDSLYPNDKARDYMPNELRGIWEVMWEVNLASK